MAAGEAHSASHASNSRVTSPSARSTLRLNRASAESPPGWMVNASSPATITRAPLDPYVSRQKVTMSPRLAKYSCTAALPRWCLAPSLVSPGTTVSTASSAR